MIRVLPDSGEVILITKEDRHQGSPVATESEINDACSIMEAMEAACEGREGLDAADAVNAALAIVAHSVRDGLLSIDMVTASISDLVYDEASSNSFCARAFCASGIVHGTEKLDDQELLALAVAVQELDRASLIAITPIVQAMGQGKCFRGCATCCAKRVRKEIETEEEIGTGEGDN